MEPFIKEMRPEFMYLAIFASFKGCEQGLAPTRELCINCKEHKGKEIFFHLRRIYILCKIIFQYELL